MHTITILVGPTNEDGQFSVQIVPNDGLGYAEQLSALRAAESRVIVQLVQEAEERGRSSVEEKIEEKPEP